VEGDGGGLHGYAALLLVGPRVEVADLAGEFGGYDAVCGEEGVGEGGLAVVLVGGSGGVLREGDLEGTWGLLTTWAKIQIFLSVSI
jgi:hypothetical protein